MELELPLANEAATVAAGAALGRACQAQGVRDGLVLFLYGQLGAGKTTFCRGVLRAFGHEGAVKSPTYTLVEPYDFPLADRGPRGVYHFDLYRLGDAEELEYMGVRDYFGPRSLCLVEWPERGAGVLPEPDLQLELEVSNGGRQLRLMAQSPAGETLVAAIQKLL